MIELYQFRPKFGVPNLSPFCLKLETWLKMTGLEYRVNYIDDPRKAPLGKLPFIKDDSLCLADSSIIIDHLERHYAISLDAHLSTLQKAHSHACKVMVEERLYWALVYHRWLGEGWPQIKEAVFSVLPPLLRQVLPVMVQRKIRADLNSQGLGRHSIEQINRFAEQDLQSLSDMLQDQPYFNGDQPSSIDAVMFSMLCQIYHANLKTPLSDIAQRFPNLDEFQKRIGRQFFPEYYV